MRHVVRHPTEASKAWSILRPTCSAVRRGAQDDCGERRAKSNLFADRVSGPTIGTTLLTRADSSVLISVLRFLHAIDFEMVGVERG